MNPDMLMRFDLPTGRPSKNRSSSLSAEENKLLAIVKNIRGDKVFLGLRPSSSPKDA